MLSKGSVAGVQRRGWSSGKRGQGRQGSWLGCVGCWVDGPNRFPMWGGSWGGLAVIKQYLLKPVSRGEHYAIGVQQRSRDHN